MTLNKVLVTGGAGFIGSNSVNYFLEQGLEVIVLDNLHSGKLTNLNLQHPNLEFIEGDILEFPFLADLIKQVDAVLHLAAIPSIQESIHNPIYTFQVNLQGTLHVLEAVRQAKQPPATVLASSAAVYGEQSELPHRDSVPHYKIPGSPYALHKFQVEEYADLYSSLFGISSICLRYFNVYGPKQDPSSQYSGVISRFLAASQSDRHCTIFGNGEQTRDFIHVSEVARANLLALQKQDLHAKLNIATGIPHSLLNLIQCIEETSEGKMIIDFQPKREGDIEASYGSTKEAKEKIGFENKISFSEGIKKLFEN